MRLRSIIGKRWQIFAGALLAAVLLAVLALDGFHLRPRIRAGQRAQSASGGLNEYSYDLLFRPEESSLAVTMTLQYTNRTGNTLESLLLRTWAGAYAKEETSPAAIDALYEACYPQGFDPGGIAVEGVWWNGETVKAAFAVDAGTALQVAVPPLGDRESGQLLLRCRITVPACAHRFGYSQGIWQFGNILPILAVYENGQWRSEEYSPIGDPFYSECANYTVSLVAPQGFACASTGSQTVEKRQDGSQCFRMQAFAARDFAFALSENWQKAQQKTNGILVTAYGPAQESARDAAKAAAKALDAYRRLYGEYAWDTYTVCAVDFPFGGMEYPGLAFIGLPAFEKDRADSLELTIAHETAHQWFYALVGSDQINEPWQDEAISEYAMLRYVREQYGWNAYKNLCITRAEAPMRERIPQRVTPATPITGFGSPDVYSAVVYGRGCAFLLAAEELTGKLDAVLRAYCDKYAFALASRGDFAGLLNSVTGEDLTPLLIDYLDTLI